METTEWERLRAAQRQPQVPGLHGALRLRADRGQPHLRLPGAASATPSAAHASPGGSEARAGHDDEPALEGWTPEITDRSDARGGHRSAFDYRGDVTVVSRDGTRARSAISSTATPTRAVPFVQIVRPRGRRPQTIPYADDPRDRVHRQGHGGRQLVRGLAARARGRRPGRPGGPTPPRVRPRPRRHRRRPRGARPGAPPRPRPACSGSDWPHLPRRRARARLRRARAPRTSRARRRCRAALARHLRRRLRRARARRWPRATSSCRRRCVGRGRRRLCDRAAAAALRRAGTLVTVDGRRRTPAQRRRDSGWRPAPSPSTWSPR